MAATRIEDRPPRSRADSFQKMLDLEKRYKLARLHNSQIPQTSQTSSAPAPTVSFQPQTRPPIQAKRRDSREFLGKHNDGHAHLRTVPCATPVATLTVNIPSPSVAIQQRIHSHEKKSEVNDMTTDESKRTPKQENHGDTAGRHKKTRFLMEENTSNDGDQDYPSDHSSICQSPSWEGYGKKKGKRTEAEPRKKEKDRVSQDQKAPEKKTTNRLYKSPPQNQQRPPSSSAVRQDGILKSSNKPSIDESSIRQRTVPEASNPPKIAEPKPRATKPRPASAQIATASAPPTDPPHHSRPHLPHVPGSHSHEKNPRGASAGKAAEASPRKQPLDVASSASTNAKPAPATATGTKTSYPPLSSRSRNLNMPMSRAHVRRNSASAIASAKLEEMSNFFKSKNAKSQLDSGNGTTPDQEQINGSASNDRGRQGESYVSRVRAQSIERSITGFIEQTALSFSNRVSGQPHKHRAQHSSEDQRIASEEIGANEYAVEESTVPTETETASHFHSVSKANSSTSSDLTTATTHTGGMLSSIKSRMRRRSSSSNGTAPAAAYKFREKAMHAMHMSGSSSTLPQHSSQTTLSSQTTTSERVAPISKKDTQLPSNKLNTEASSSHTVRINGRPSEVSSSSSHHGDFSVPSSPGTPDTSRPQSTKGLAATVEKFRVSSEAQMSGALSSGAAKAGSATQPARGAHEKAMANRNEGNGSRPGARHGGDIIERPISRGRFLERVERPGSSERFLEDVQQPMRSDDIRSDDDDSDTLTAPDIDALSFVTTLTNQETHPETSPKIGHENKSTGPVTHQSPHVLEEKAGSEAKVSGSQPRKDMRDKLHAKHMSILNEEGQSSEQSDEALTSGLVPPTPPASSSGRSSPSTAYLQEARFSAPTVSSPLANVVNSAKASLSNLTLSAESKPDLKTATSFSSQPSSKALLPISGPHRRIPAHEPEKLAKPIAKMLVQCCHCRFFHDMPSRIYECMAQPDAVVTDRNLGVSGAITTMVKCPWCAHNMSRKCCAGYAAVVYLKERLH